eukprot:8517539-Pyramimonas_sp.AAC.1
MYVYLVRLPISGPIGSAHLAEEAHRERHLGVRAAGLPVACGVGGHHGEEVGGGEAAGAGEERHGHDNRSARPAPHAGDHNHLLAAHQGGGSAGHEANGEMVLVVSSEGR